MTFKLEHWSNPRKTIASVYEDNDMAYSLHGTKCATDTIKALDLKPSELGKMSILDYGCGTGKNLRAIQYFFKECVGYDPSENCIKLCKSEQAYINQPVPDFPKKKPLVQENKMFYSHNFNEISGRKFDVIQCHDVLQHLDYDKCVEAYNNMYSVLNEEGYLILNISKAKNIRFYEKYLKDARIFENYFIKNKLCL